MQVRGEIQHPAPGSVLAVTSLGATPHLSDATMAVQQRTALLTGGVSFCIQLFEVPQMITVILVVLVIMCFGGGFAFPDPNYRYAGGGLGLILLILLICMLVGVIHV